MAKIKHAMEPCVDICIRNNKKGDDDSEVNFTNFQFLLAIMVFFTD